jgi:hypothetical protein
MTAPGEGITVAGFPEASGTSFAAPHVTGIIAQLLSDVPDLLNKPVLINSILKTGTTHKTADDYGAYSSSPYYSDKEGAGVVDAKGAYTVCHEKNYVQVTLSKDQFPMEKYISVKSPSSLVRVTLAWLMQNQSPSGDSAGDEQLSDLDLYAYNPDGTQAAYSGSAKNNCELIEFTPSTAGEYRIKIDAYSLRNKSELVGISWQIVPAPIASPDTDRFLQRTGAIGVRLKGNRLFVEGQSRESCVPLTVTLFSLDGKRIVSLEGAARDGGFTLPRTAFCSGAYIASLASGNRTIAKRTINIAH